MSGELEQYEVVKCNSDSEFKRILNEMYSMGYKVLESGHVWETERFETEWWAVLYQSKSEDVRNATNAVIVEFDKNTEDGTPLIEQFTGRGWFIVDTFSKHCVMLQKPKKEEE